MRTASWFTLLKRKQMQHNCSIFILDAWNLFCYSPIQWLFITLGFVIYVYICLQVIDSWNLHPLFTLQVLFEILGFLTLFVIHTIIACNKIWQWKISRETIAYSSVNRIIWQSIHIDTACIWFNNDAGKYMVIKDNLLVNLLTTIEHNLNKVMLSSLLPKVIKAI